MKNLTVEFLHPGVEADLKYKKPVSIKDVHMYTDKHFVFPLIENREIGVRYWNKYPHHKKKFLISQGKFIKDLPFDNLTDLIINNLEKSVYNNCISFWGEWEPQSFFKFTNSDIEESPKQVHFPFFIEYTPPNNGRCHSTDPYVFGKRFLYTHCLQGPREDGTDKRTDRYLKSPNLKMILFGYEFPFSTDPDDFILDTLIVIDKTKEKEKFEKHSKIFELANLRFTNIYNFKYQGIMYNDYKGIFSFVPCKIYNKEELFYRNDARLNWKSFGLQKPGARQGLTEIDTFSDDDLILFWKKIVKVLIDNNINLGVDIDEPKYFHNYIDAWTYYNSDENKCRL